MRSQNTNPSMTIPTASAPALQASFVPLDPRAPLGDDVLAAIVFGGRTECPDDPRCLRIGLDALDAQPCAEVWRGRRKPRLGTSGPIRFVEDGECFFGWISLDESRLGGIVEAAEAAYRGLLSFHAVSPYRNVLRMWNFVTDINEGTGDDERYKLFSLGRARAFAAAHALGQGIGYPAATAVGKPGGPRTLEVCWMAGHESGAMVENPRQLAAYHYPRRYGPAAPSFSRAMLIDAPMLLVSGTASIVGHESLHEGDILAQIDETLTNLDALLRKAHAEGRIRSRSLGASSLLKAYVRPGVDAARVRQHLSGRLGDVPTMLVRADICRKELLIEIEAVHPA